MAGISKTVVSLHPGKMEEVTKFMAFFQLVDTKNTDNKNVTEDGHQSENIQNSLPISSDSRKENTKKKKVKMI